MIRGAVAAAAAIAATALAVSAEASEPGYLPLNHQRIVPYAPADVWRRLHDFFEDQGIAVTSEDLKAGLIEASRTTKGRDSLHGLAECPQHMFWSPQSLETQLTVHVRPSDEGGTKVTADARFLEIGRPTKKGIPTFACVSTGVLEAAVLNVASGQPMQSAVVPP